MKDLSYLLILYPEYVNVLGPYLRKDGRKHIILWNKDVGRKTISYPKALMECHLKRKLEDNETVDHKDEDFTNDDFSNLRVITRSANSSRSAIKRFPIFGNCLMCNSEFELSRGQIAKRANKNAGPFCSRKCSGQYGKMMQLNLIDQFQRHIPDSVYYKEEDGGITLL